MTFSLKMYTEYGAPVLGRGTSVESTDVNWKTTQDPTQLYINNPIKRPTPAWSYVLNDWDYGQTADIDFSLSQYNYFRITGVTGKVIEPQIIICSSTWTKPVIGTILDSLSGEYYPIVSYMGSGWADGIEIRKDIQKVYIELDEYLNDVSYRVTKLPTIEPEAPDNSIEDLLKSVLSITKSISVELTKTQLDDQFVNSFVDTANSAHDAYVNHSLWATPQEVADLKKISDSFYPYKDKVVASIYALGKKSTIEVSDYVYFNENVIGRLNIGTGGVDKARYVPTAEFTITDSFKSAEGEDVGYATTGNLKSNKTYLFAGLSNTYSEPTSAMINNLRFVSNGNLTIPVALSSSPLIAGPKQDEYTGADLYSPYIVSQLRLAAAKYDDVGNSPQYRILFSCKVYN